MLAKKQARFGGIQATVNRILAEDKKNRRRSSKAKNDDIAATEEDKDAEQRDPLSHSSVPRRKKKHSKELMSWQKNAASAAERRERGRKTMQAHKKVAKRLSLQAIWDRRYRHVKRRRSVVQIKRNVFHRGKYGI